MSVIDEYEDYEDFDETELEEAQILPGEEQLAKDRTYLPEVQYYMRTYAQSLGNNDKKAATVFKQYESMERVRRLQNELQNIKDGRASDNICNQLMGKKRKSKHKTYEHWAELMLLWINSAQR